MGRNIFDDLRKAGEAAKTGDGDSVENLFGQSAEEATCTPDGLFKADAAWQPKFAKRRVEVMVTGRPGRVGVVRETVNDLQKQLFDVVKEGQLEMRVTAFLDDCRHSTSWSHSPVDVGGGTTQWHCHQNRTLFTQAMAISSREQLIDAIIIYGDRFDDNLPETMLHIEALKAQGTRIFAFHVGDGVKSRQAYEQLAEKTGGVCVQLTDERAFAQVMPIITDFLFRREEALLALPAPNNPDVKALVDRLRVLPEGNDKVK